MNALLVLTRLRSFIERRANKKVYIAVFVGSLSLLVLANENEPSKHEQGLNSDASDSNEVLIKAQQLGPVLVEFENIEPKIPALLKSPITELETTPNVLGPLTIDKTTQETIPLEAGPLLVFPELWSPITSPLLDSSASKSIVKKDEKPKKANKPSEMLAVDTRPHRPRIAILIDDLGYNRHGMEASLALPNEVALAILPGTPFATKTAIASQKQGRMTLLHAPMENQRALKLGPGGLYARMDEQELKKILVEDIEGLPGIQGVNNHMGSLLTTKQQSMNWVMEILKERGLFFIDSLTSPNSVAHNTAEAYGLKTTTRDVFLDNIRTEKAIDKQFSRLLKLSRRHGSALAIGHPYPETTTYLAKRLQQLQENGVILVPLSEILKTPNN